VYNIIYYIGVCFRYICIYNGEVLYVRAPRRKQRATGAITNIILYTIIHIYMYIIYIYIYIYIYYMEMYMVCTYVPPPPQLYNIIKYINCRRRKVLRVMYILCLYVCIHSYIIIIILYICVCA